MTEKNLAEMFPLPCSIDFVVCLFLTFVSAAQTDKASMLEEIIEYIKFLQLQTKVRVPSVTLSQNFLLLLLLY